MAISTSDLDFANIKARLKSQLKKNDTFKDYDFEASGMSTILDVLAYNTHINGLVANMGINEAFLSSSQLRASALSHAETLGYVPKSSSCPVAEISAEVEFKDITDPAVLPDFLIMPEGQEFTVSVDEVVYSFYTTEEYIAHRPSELPDTLPFTVTYQFKSAASNPVINLIQGEIKSKTFVAGGPQDNNLYILPDKDLDVNTITVEVYDNFSSTSSVSYKNLNEVRNITKESRVYMIRETSNGEYEMFFSDGTILGTAPSAGNKIVVSYRVTAGEEANGGDLFATTEIYEGGNYLNVKVIPISRAAGGSGKETLSSIKKNAPRAFVAQNRLVTADDYRSLILNNFDSYITDVSAWGGNDNVPPEYGKVFVSINYADGLSDLAQEDVQESIREQLTSNISIMSIDTEFVKPNFTKLELQTVFQIDATKNISTLETLQSRVNTVVEDYVKNELNAFGATFRRSNLLTRIDALSPAILNSRMTVKMQQTIPITQMISDVNGMYLAAGLSGVDYLDQDFEVKYPTIIAEADNDEHTVMSSVFRSKGKNVYIRNLLGSTRLQLVDVNGVLVLDNIGSYDPAKGLVKLVALYVDGVGYGGAGIKISATPANQSTIRPLRNYILSLDSSMSFARGTMDEGDIKVTL